MSQLRRSFELAGASASILCMAPLWAADWPEVPVPPRSELEMVLRDGRVKTVAQRDQLEIPFAVVVGGTQSCTMTAANLGMGASSPSVAGSPDMPERMAGNRYQAMAKARVFFERPKRGLPNDFTAASLWRPDSAQEYGSLYSPYWQARLTDFSQSEKMALLAAMGITPDHALYTPGGQHP